MSIYDNNDDFIIGADNVFDQLVVNNVKALSDVGANLVTSVGDTLAFGKKKIETSLKAGNLSAPDKVVAASPAVSFNKKVNPLYIAAIALVLGAVVISKSKRRK